MSIPGIDQNIGSLLTKAAEEYGDKNLLHFHQEDVDFTYRQMNNLVNQYAHALRKTGIRRGDHLAVMLSNCPAFFLIWLALARIGATMVPLNIRYQAKDLVYVLNNSDAVGLVIESEFASVYREAGPDTPGIKTVLTIGAGAEDLGPVLDEMAKSESSIFSGPDISISDTMSIQYTSGTTGFPKGCLLTHEYWLTLGFVAAVDMKTDDIFLCVEPFYYMDPPWELIMCMLKGMTMVVAKSYSPSRYMALVRQYGITVSWVMLPAWIYKQPVSGRDTDHHLRFLLSGAIPKEIHEPFEKRFNVLLREGYGMTEIGPGMAMPVADRHMSGSGSVGKPLAYRYVKIVDEDGNDVSEGETGELWITGPGMFSGYYKKPKATEAAFSGKWFKTGDLFRQDDRGYYYIVGRKKDMIKRSGDNIAAVEVENVLISHPKIQAVAVVPVPDPDRKEEVKAYILPAPGENPETIPPDELIKFCQEQIADFKVPRYIEYRTEDFPRTPTGKIQKIKLIAEGKDLTRGCYDRLAT